MAKFYLGEQVSIYRLLAVLLGFVGVVVMIEPVGKSNLKFPGSDRWSKYHGILVDVFLIILYVRFILGLTNLRVFGTECFQFCCDFPDIINREPWLKSTLTLSRPSLECRINFLVAPRLIDAIIGNFPNSGSLSLCEPILSAPSR